MFWVKDEYSVGDMMEYVAEFGNGDSKYMVIIEKDLVEEYGIKYGIIYQVFDLTNQEIDKVAAGSPFDIRWKKVA